MELIPQKQFVKSENHSSFKDYNIELKCQS